MRYPLDLPPDVDRRFAEDMRAYFAEQDGAKRDAIAARQRHALSKFQSSREIKLRLPDVKRMFILMKNKS